jgi:hypothetical protein
LWAQAYIIDGGQRLGGNFYDFRQAHFYQADYSGYKFEILPGRVDYIYEQLTDITYRVESTQGVDTPNVINLPPRWLDMPDDTGLQYRQLERNFIITMKRKREALPDGLAEIVAEDAAHLYGKLRQFAQGFLYHRELGEDESTPLEMLSVHRAKFRELHDLVSELQGQQLMIVYHYRAQLNDLRSTYPDMGFLSGGMKDTDASATIEAWNAGTLQLLAVQPASAGHGLNLQKSGAHHIVFLTLPESAGLCEQVVGRLARGGNPAGDVFVHRILMRDTVDEERNAIVNGKIMTQDDMLDAMMQRTGNGK